MNVSPQLLWEDLQAIRRSSPLIHNLTNYVVMETTANALLALGASPIMSVSPEEAADLTTMAHALVINMGTPNSAWLASVKEGLQAAQTRAKPVIFDPVGAGANQYRKEMAKQLCANKAISVIRGNASEIAALAGLDENGKGVDATLSSLHALEAAQHLARALQKVVVVSGEVDVILDGKRICQLSNGHPIMTRVTGVGCSASACLGAFLAVNRDPFLAAVHTMALFGVAGELAEQRSQGAGSFPAAFLDLLYGITSKEIEKTIRGHICETAC